MTRTPGKTASPQTLIQMAFDEAGGDRQEAAQRVIAAAKTSMSLSEYLIALGARSAVGNLICSDRSKIYNDDPTANVMQPRMQPPRVEALNAARTRVMGRAARNVRMMLDATLYGGKKRMAEASKADILESAAAYEKSGTHDLALSKYQYMVAAQLQDGKLAGDCFTNETLTALFDQAKASMRSKEQAA